MSFSQSSTSLDQADQITQVPVSEFIAPADQAAQISQLAQMPARQYITPSQEATLALLPALQDNILPEAAPFAAPTSLQDLDYGTTMAHLDPAIVLDETAVYDNNSVWSTPQSVRTNQEFLNGYPPMTAFGPDAIVASLNYTLGQSIANNDVTEGEALFVLEHYTEAFRLGLNL